MLTEINQQPQKKHFFMMIGIMLIAANLRAGLTSVGPLLGFIRDDTGLSHSWSGLITTLPLLGFALFSPLAPKLAHKVGLERTILYSLLALTAGIILRSVSSIFTLFLGTAILGLAIAVGNVLLPSLIKREFPLKVGLLTGGYTMCMGIFASIASGISVPLAHALPIGWRGSLAFWAILSFITFFIWLPNVKNKGKADYSKLESSKVKGVWQSPLAWKVTFFMGLQSFGFYVSITWLPQILHDRGLSLATGGAMLSLMQVVSIPVSFMMPIIAGKSENQKVLAAIASVLCFSGYLGIFIGGNTLIPLWIVLIGLGQGACISLALTFIALRASNPFQAAALSGMAQSIGYLLAAIGPMVFGLLYDVTNSWTGSLLLLIGVTIAQCIFGIGAGQNRTIFSHIREKKHSIASM
ncbi:CynX/NimT family MFS transporter [Bacillus chungangensis]|uniref:CP family cyanate transporter-like MFS transporter n=1 Tax=Bacillus chungangensis TaxID=587633 RepID=A0ABT9WTV6_9BACI|nr:MFS transporter [Bacillus chungangensis]MDQ0176669.1 CP family cyanate transporter-like MFS transporter [Bacillus chungangensis]